MKNDFINKLNAYTVLYAEDEDGIRNNIQEILTHLFKEVICVKNASDAYMKYLEYNPDLIITDIKMGNETGIDLLKKIRKSDSKTRIIITSAYTDLEYLLQATELHLIKYIIKPITQDKLMEALEAFINSYDTTKIYNLIPNWIFNFSKATISNSKEEFTLTKKENIFLKLLISKNRIITYEELETNIWDEDSIMTANAMRLFIKNFRKKLPKDFLKNIQGVGYKLVRD
ncbi:MAG: response regulator transcription factor [Arcobacter sp.]|jgi:DNA-binding response OmpR family regulator|uniref:Two-component system response regulator n=1 Tax=Arcobacter defluvii TaxID=873191 RepID=A0AAE7E846_9BACT|nr:MULTISPECIES: response regulator transcription factor [Arcobacter]MDY3199671.1 response regulator transcription factor [Arcobacter sp.]QKF78398.1 two-component system response regulator [Arcobacter defluvii]RXI30817.1 DNA-binding response regulator [Arcobacter defluvii]BAK74183.1 two-component response regulator [Arcobacter sp. L]